MFNRTLDNYFKVPDGNDVCTLTKKDKVQITDTTIKKLSKYPIQ